MAQQPFYIEHLACQCQDRTPKVCATAREVVVYLWGRDVVEHRVCHPDCTYRFWTGDLNRIEALLEPVGA
jgi:hypothetical protein